ncbi:unnamed protein product [Heterobilharzia americana]|nr:unnamed protein product [Heterobilharzia americana]
MLENNVDPANVDIVSKYLNPKSSDNRVDISEDPDIQDSENRDYYGFYHPNGLTRKEKIIENKYRKNDIRRVDKWLKMIYKWEEVDSLWHRMYKNGRASEKLTRRIFKGIPDRFRMTVWPLLLCVADAKNRNKDIYAKMLNQALSSSCSLNQIDLDVNRTFRNTIYFRDRYGPRQCALFRVLAAYSVYNSEVGYCQGMSELAGLFLIYIEDEEDAFWALNQLMTGYRHNMHSVYVADFPGLKRLFTHHERIVRKLLPILDKHFTKHDMLTSTYALKWYMQCFLDRLPVTLVLRLWDIYLLEGEKLLLAMAYNILKMHNKRLLRMDQMQMTSFFQDELAKDFMFDDDDVIDSLKDCLELLHKNKLDTPPPLHYNDKVKRRPYLPTPLTTSMTTESPSSRLGRWTSEQVLSVNVNEPSSTTSSEISLEQPWQKREKSPSEYDQSHGRVITTTPKAKDDYLWTTRTAKSITSSVDGVISKLDGTLVPATTTAKEVWATVGNNYIAGTDTGNANSNLRMNRSMYSPVSPDLSTGSQDTKYSHTVFTSSSSLSPASKRIQIIRVPDNDNYNNNNINNMNKKSYYESVKPINDYVRRIPSTPRSNIIMKPTEILMPEPKPIFKTVNKKLITVQLKK